ncbi:MAG: type I restriction endonuclease subunit R, partial [Acidimicrobiales bacterium]
ASTRELVLKELCRWLETQGPLAVLRHGFQCYGQNIRLAYFRGANGLNPEVERLYQLNRVGLTRQLRYSSKHSNELDLTISVNGLPVFTLELKNAFTGSDAADAVKQYKTDRDPRELIFEFKKRALAHFAVDTDTVWMTTRLAGKATHFLPFNRGFQDGAGNPPDPNGKSYRTAYLWEEVLSRDSVLDLLARFIHLQVEEKRDEAGRKYKKETLIFPRFHQWQAVRALENAARANGAGHNYLIEHSAGSGKSNTIGWLAHRLAFLHRDDDSKVFDSVIVITDRRVLDRQLQDTIYQIEHRQGVVQKIDKSSAQLAQSLQDRVPIVITTLQKFPFVAQQLMKVAERKGQSSDGVLPTRQLAVIVDEAHSSQSGESATDLKEVLGGEALRAQAKQAAQEGGKDELENVFASLARRGKQPNLSFFAFTATPKFKTFGVFADGGASFHKYTMKQAIEEGFILDVLRNYVTYKTFFKLAKTGSDDPHVERKKAAKALSRYLVLHPYNVAQKTVVMVEHFNEFTRHKIGGKAKAMVVTGSRLAAIRYKQAFDHIIKERGYHHIKTLMAFSGTVEDDKIPGVTYLEEEMNGGIRESELPERFAGEDYQLLLVADKYQTGFDQPLLHTMYVDKRLSGIQAVQTLSRLNRTHPLKEDTFVLDFVNDRAEILASFADYYTGAEKGEDVEPARLYELQATLESGGIYDAREVEAFERIFFKRKAKQAASDHQAMALVLESARDRFAELFAQSEDEAEKWRGALVAFTRLYGYLSQIIPFGDSDLEQLYAFLRFLEPRLQQPSSGAAYTFDDDVKLDSYRLQKASEGALLLSQSEAEALRGPQETGTRRQEDESVPLSQLVETLNDRLGTQFTLADQLFFDQLVEAALQEESLQQAAQANPEDKFQLIFRRLLQTLFVERMDQNEELFARFVNEGEFSTLIAQDLGNVVYRRLATKK